METEARKATAALAESLSRGDAARAAALYVDNARLLTPRAELVAGRAEIDAYWQTGITLRVSGLELETLRRAVDSFDPGGRSQAIAVEAGKR